jgi:hypothetical protein
VTNSIASLKSKQAKFVAMRKHLNQFEKEWSKQVKVTKVSKKAKSKTRKKTIRIANDRTDKSADKISMIKISEGSMDNTQHDQELENTGT